MRLKKETFFIERLLMMDGVSGEMVIDIPLDARYAKRFGNPDAVTHRADIHGALLDGCREQRWVELRASTRVTGFLAEGNGVVVEIYGGERISAAALIGADGGRSVVRSRIVGDGEPPVSGHMCYR